MSIIALYRSELVEVLDVWQTSNGRKVAEIASLDGEPRFTGFSFTGGAYESNTRTVQAGLLEPVTDCGCVVPEQHCQACSLQNVITYAREVL